MKKIFAALQKKNDDEDHQQNNSFTENETIPPRRLLPKLKDISRNPDQLTNEHIQELGEAYIAAYGENAGMMHKSQAFALKLQGYNEDSSAHSKWIFLIEIYETLLTNDGKLANAIGVLFNKAFNRNILKSNSDPVSTSVFSTQETANFCLRNMVAQFYARKYREINVELKKININLKKKLSVDQEVDVSFETDTQSKLISDQFKDPDDLTNAHIQALANNYVQSEQYKNKIQIYTELKNYNENSSTHDKWNKLVSIYLQLPNNNNDLAIAIRDLFNKAYQQEIKVTHGDSRSVTFYSVRTVAELYMHNFIAHYYVFKYMKENAALDRENVKLQKQLRDQSSQQDNNNNNDCDEDEVQIERARLRN